MPDSILEADNLHVWRGERHVLRGVSFELASGHGLQLVGANGAGKTTLLRTLAALRPPEEGVVRWKGSDVRRDLGAYHASLAYAGHEPALKPDLTVFENLRYAIGLRRRLTNLEVESALSRLGNTGWRDTPVRLLSAGQRRRVALCTVFLLQTPLWLLDEPTTNLDVEGQTLVASLVDEHLTGGGIVVAAVHHPLAVKSVRLQQLALDARDRRVAPAHG